ncbi:MAG: hypothetical protein U0457_12900 [Candidatus Sericytochromatia bacterium]
MSIVSIIGGASFDQEIANIFKPYNIEIIHYDARKSASLKKQTLTKNTVGAIITVNRSHQTFGNSNEIIRYLEEKNIPYTFSSSNLASLNSAKILLQKILHNFPELKIKLTNQKEQKLDYYKNSWEICNEDFFKLLNQYMFIIDVWDKKNEDWSYSLSIWKEALAKFKLDTSDKEIKKKLGFKLNNLLFWKNSIHELGIDIERYINISKSWKKELEDNFNELSTNHNNLEDFIKQDFKVFSKELKIELKNWSISFEEWSEQINLTNSDMEEWYNFFLEAFERIIEWDKEHKLFSSSYLRNFTQNDKYN